MTVTTKLNLYRMQKTHHQIMHNVPDVAYGFGSKVRFKQPGFQLSSIRAIDCSGLVGLLVYYGCGKKDLSPMFPDGSYNQRDWLLARSKETGSVIHRVNKYSDIANDPSKLYLCTLNPIYEHGRMVKAGHVWFVNDGFTMESHGGTGPSERPYNTPILKTEVDFVFRWEHDWIENDGL